MGSWGEWEDRGRAKEQRLLWRFLEMFVQGCGFSGLFNVDDDTRRRASPPGWILVNLFLDLHLWVGNFSRRYTPPSPGSRFRDTPAVLVLPWATLLPLSFLPFCGLLLSSWSRCHDPFWESLINTFLSFRKGHDVGGKGQFSFRAIPDGAVLGGTVRKSDLDRAWPW